MFKLIKTPEQIQLDDQAAKDTARIEELKRLLSESDFKVMPDYDRPSDAIRLQRQSWREEIRSLEGD